MPSINLDNQVFFDSNQLRIPKIQRQEPDILCENAHIPQPQAGTPSNDDAIVISSDDESDCEDSASVRSSSSLSPIDQLLAETQERRTVTDLNERKKSLDTSISGACDGHLAQDPMMDGPELRGPPQLPDRPILETWASMQAVWLNVESEARTTAMFARVSGKPDIKRSAVLSQGFFLFGLGRLLLNEQARDRGAHELLQVEDVLIISTLELEKMWHDVCVQISLSGVRVTSTKSVSRESAGQLYRRPGRQLRRWIAVQGSRRPTKLVSREAAA
ncbi:hypothetical protein PT974_07490 [Cladobotryum mycophilum]|uniref:Uncharacterized protein n=1 Tax=Cladobotryum mycophilum TaxID=491253 RepID=A0ABR0SQN9_9HYPO